MSCQGYHMAPGDQLDFGSNPRIQMLPWHAVVHLGLILVLWSRFYQGPCHKVPCKRRSTTRFVARPNPNLNLEFIQAPPASTRVPRVRVNLQWSVSCTVLLLTCLGLGFVRYLFWTFLPYDCYTDHLLIVFDVLAFELVSLSTPGSHNSPKFLKTCFEALETSFRAKICTNSPKICTNSPILFFNNIITRLLNNFRIYGSTPLSGGLQWY